MSFGGNKNAAYNRNLRNYMKDVPDSKFESYVDSKGDLANAWLLINDYQSGKRGDALAHHAPRIVQNGMSPEAQAQYWIKKAEGGRFTKADFGRFHAGEDEALLTGTYPGGTKVKPGTAAYDAYFPTDKTRYQESVAAAAATPPPAPPPPSKSLPSGNIVTSPAAAAYQPPAAKDWTAYNPLNQFVSNRLFSPHANLAARGLMLYQPWSKEALEETLPSGLIGYTPKTLPSWTLNRTPWVDWADYKDLPTYSTDEEEDEDDDEDPKEGGGNN